MKSAKINLILVLVGVFWGDASIAALPFDATPEEKEVCSAQIPPNSGAPHYCECIRFRHRAMKAFRNREDFKYYIGEALEGCNYALGRVSPTSSIRPRILIDKGRALVVASKKIEAEQAFFEAAQANPKQIDAYVELVNLQRAMSRQGDALETAKEGLRYFPESDWLKKMYLNLGGKEPLPDPVARPELKSKGTPATSEDPRKGKGIGVDDPHDLGGESSGSLTETVKSGGSKGAEDEVSGCRFCPPEEIQKRWRESFQPGK